MSEKTFTEKVVTIQTELKAPKGQFNKFGNYKYRSLEDINEALKPLLAREQLQLTVSDELVLIGDRYYVKATATISDSDGNYVEVHQRHERCRCTVDYNPGNGRKQDVWSKTWRDSQKEQRIANRKMLNLRKSKQ